jgi:hypothetical protein
MVIIRWFPLHRFAVSLHHRLICLLPLGARGRDIIDLCEVEIADPANEYALNCGTLNDGRLQPTPEIRLRETKRQQCWRSLMIENEDRQSCSTALHHSTSLEPTRL